MNIYIYISIQETSHKTKRSGIPEINIHSVLKQFESGLQTTLAIENALCLILVNNKVPVYSQLILKATLTLTINIILIAELRKGISLMVSQTVSQIQNIL